MELNKKFKSQKEKPEINPLPHINPEKPSEPEISPLPEKITPQPNLPETEPIHIPEIKPDTTKNKLMS